MKWITSELMEELTIRAGAQLRRRINHNVHESPSDPVQRLFIVTKLGSYFRPHRHPRRWEFAVVLRGRFDVVVFDDAGRVVERRPVGPGQEAVGFEMPANTWHSWIPTSEDSVFFELKQGPYDPQTAAEFAAWAPAEGAAQVPEFAARMGKAKVGELV